MTPAHASKKYSAGNPKVASANSETRHPSADSTVQLIVRPFILQ